MEGLLGAGLVEGSGKGLECRCSTCCRFFSISATSGGKKYKQWIFNDQIWFSNCYFIVTKQISNKNDCNDVWFSITHQNEYRSQCDTPVWWRHNMVNSLHILYNKHPIAYLWGMGCFLRAQTDFVFSLGFCGAVCPIMLQLHLTVSIQSHLPPLIRKLSWLALASHIRKQGKSEGFDSCDRPSNLAQIWSKSLIFQPMWPWNLMDDLGKQ